MLEQKEVEIQVMNKLAFCYKNIPGRRPETTRIVVQNNLYPNLDKSRKLKKTLEKKIVDQYNIKSVKIFSVQGCG